MQSEQMELWSTPKRKFRVSIGVDVTQRFEMVVALPTSTDPNRERILSGVHLEDTDPNDLLDWSNAIIEEIKD